MMFSHLGVDPNHAIKRITLSLRGWSPEQREFIRLMFEELNKDALDGLGQLRTNVNLRKVGDLYATNMGLVVPTYGLGLFISFHYESKYGPQAILCDNKLSLCYFIQEANPPYYCDIETLYWQALIQSPDLREHLRGMSAKVGRNKLQTVNLPAVY